MKRRNFLNFLGVFALDINTPSWLLEANKKATLSLEFIDLFNPETKYFVLADDNYKKQVSLSLKKCIQFKISGLNY